MAVPVALGEPVRNDSEPSDVAAIERMVDEGGPASLLVPESLTSCPLCGAPKSPRAPRCARCAGQARRSKALLEPDQPTIAADVYERRTRRSAFRVYCVSCGRSTTVAVPPARSSRCATCGGTMLTEHESLY